jgi:MoaA/NifB/PqqE/SkfB family radical SAM enzyme
MNGSDSLIYHKWNKQGKLENNLCKHPFTGFYIGPTGNIVLCCMGQDLPLAHIDNVDDLELFYNDSVMEKFRKGLGQGKYSIMPPCNTCYQMELQDLNPFKTSMGNTFKFKNFDDDWKAWQMNDHRPMRYLEYTLSNICNADCATCNSEWSSKWQELDRKFNRSVTPLQKVADKNIAKIEKVLYGLEHLMIKGGEPFADIRNIRILQKLIEVNPNCQVHIVSNFHAITPEAMDIIANLPNVNFIASIDAVTSETYKWIRGGNFEKTIANMKTVSKLTNNKISVNVTISLYNYFLLDKIRKFFAEQQLEGYFKNINFSSIAREPHHTIGLLPEQLYNKQQDKLKKHFADDNNQLEFNELNCNIVNTSAIYLDYEKILKPSYNSDTPIEEREKLMKDLFFRTLDQMNEHRGFDLCDYVPELKEWRINT